MSPAMYFSCKSTWQAEIIHRTCRDRVELGTMHAYARCTGDLQGLAASLHAVCARFHQRPCGRSRVAFHEPQQCEGNASRAQHAAAYSRPGTVREKSCERWHWHCQSRLLGYRQDAKMVYWSYVHERCQLLGLEARGMPRREQFPLLEA